MQFPDLGGVWGGGCGPAQALAVQPGLEQSRASSLPQNLSFEFGENREQTRHRSPSRRSQVQCLGQRNEAHSQMLQSSRAGRHTHAWHGSASEVSADRWWIRGRTGQPGTFSAVSVPGQKRYAILRFPRPVFRPFSSDAPAWPKTILSGQAGFIILRGRGCCQSSQRLAVVPRHPLRRLPLQLPGMPLQFRQVVERIDSVEFAGVNQTHE